MSPKDAYELVCKEAKSRLYVKQCKDFGPFYAFFLTLNKNDKFVGSTMTAVDKKTGKIFNYNLMDKRYSYSDAKTIKL